jgi:hypothetical protein
MDCASLHDKLSQNYRRRSPNSSSAISLARCSFTRHSRGLLSRRCDGRLGWVHTGCASRFWDEFDDREDARLLGRQPVLSPNGATDRSPRRKPGERSHSQTQAPQGGQTVRGAAIFCRRFAAEITLGSPTPGSRRGLRSAAAPRLKVGPNSNHSRTLRSSGTHTQSNELLTPRFDRGFSRHL